MSNTERIIDYLRNYPKSVKIMEVCGTHTSAIVKHGIRELLSPKIRLVSGPGCPVCVTPAGYIDDLAELAMKPDNCVLSFGDMMRVRGTHSSLSEAKAAGGCAQLIYSPLDAVAIAERQPLVQFTAAAVGFETTAPVWGLLLDEIVRRKIPNLRLMTSLKTMPAALDFICSQESVEGFLCPGHVSAVIGAVAYLPLYEKYRKPLVIAGFGAEDIILALYVILRQLETGKTKVDNLYTSVVKPNGNTSAQAIIEKYFVPQDGCWRGIGTIRGSELRIRPAYAEYEQTRVSDVSDAEVTACHCGDVMLGRIYPNECPLFGNVCKPESPVGACMVSGEGACGIIALA